MTETIVLRQRFVCAPDALWSALTDVDAVRQWLAEDAQIDLANDRFAFWGRYCPDGERQHLVAANRPRSLRFVWPIDGSDGLVSFEIDRDGDACSLTLTHEGAPARVDDAVYVRDWWLFSLDNLANFVEERSLAPKVDFTSLYSDCEARYGCEVNASPDTVFDALLNPDKIERWVGVRPTIEPVKGGRYEFGWSAGPTRILQLIPNERLAIGWSTGDAEPDTVIQWELAGSEGKTHLTVVHSGFGETGHAAAWTFAHASRMADLKRLLEVGEQFQMAERLQHAV